jgi:hypothetical protein
MLQELGTSYLSHQHRGREASCPSELNSWQNLSRHQNHMQRAHSHLLPRLRLQELHDEKLLIEELNVLLEREVD